jgi:hypothetical protein
MQQFIRIYYSMFIWSWTCFGRHTAHHQELKIELAASGFAYVKGCWTLSLLNAVSVQQPQRPTTFHVCKTRDCSFSFKLLMMSGVSSETCQASYKHGIINFDTLLHLVGYSVELYYNARIHEHQDHNCTCYMQLGSMITLGLEYLKSK